MSNKSDRLLQFFQELKRRKVVRVIAMYAATAFIIMEAADIMLPRLGLPDWTVTLVIVLLIFGLPVAIILSWIFDITPEGIIRTKQETTKAEVIKPDTKAGKRFKLSDGIIAVLLLVVCILIYPKIFKRDKLRDIRDTEGRISVAIMPFENLSGEPSIDFWQNGISEYLINDLGSSEDVNVISSQVIQEVLGSINRVSTTSITPTLARETAGKIDASTYITGNFIGPLDNISILLNLVSMENGELLWSCKVEGDLGNHYQDVLDHLADTLRNYLEIRAIEDNVSADLSYAFPKSAEAYRYYINGLNAIVTSDAQTAKVSLLKAIEIDSSFTLAAFYLAWACNMESFSIEEQAFWTDRAYSMKQNLPPVYQNWIHLWYAAVNEDINGMRTACTIMERSDIMSRFFWLDLGATYASFLSDYEKAVSAFRKVEDLCKRWNDEWEFIQYYEVYAFSLLKTGRLDEMDKIAEKGLKIDPQNRNLVVYMGARSLLKNDTTMFAYYRDQLNDINRGDASPDASNAHDIGDMYVLIDDFRTAAGYFQKAYELDASRSWSHFKMIRYGLKDNGDPEIYLKLIESELEIHPESATFIWLKGFALHKLGQNEEALEILTEVDDGIWFNSLLKDDIREVELALAKGRQ